METQNIISKVDYPTEWINLIVLVKKSDDSIRICLDPRDLNTSIVENILLWQHLKKLVYS